MAKQPRTKSSPLDSTADPFLNREQYSFARQALRRASYRWYARYAAIIAARVRRGVYVCAICKKEISNQEKQLDHVSPVVPITGPTTLGELAGRLLVNQAGWQVSCKPCHAEKSKSENELFQIKRRRFSNNWQTHYRQYDEQCQLFQSDPIA